MTYSVLNFNNKSKNITSAICSNWTGIQLCRVQGKYGVVHTQSWADYKLAYTVLELLEYKHPQEAIEEALVFDSHPHIRQLLVCDFKGNLGVYSGKDCETITLNKIGNNTVVAGNMLTDKSIADDIIEFVENSNERNEIVVFKAMEYVNKTRNGFVDKRGDSSFSIKSIPNDYKNTNEYHLDITIDSVDLNQDLYDKANLCLKEHFSRNNNILK